VRPNAPADRCRHSRWSHRLSRCQVIPCVIGCFRLTLIRRAAQECLGRGRSPGQPSPRASTTSQRRRSSPSCRPPSAVCEPMPSTTSRLLHPTIPRRVCPEPIPRAARPVRKPHQDPSPCQGVWNVRIRSKEAMRAVWRASINFIVGAQGQQEDGLLTLVLNELEDDPQVVTGAARPAARQRTA